MRRVRRRLADALDANPTLGSPAHREIDRLTMEQAMIGRWSLVLFEQAVRQAKFLKGIAPVDGFYIVQT